MDIAELLAFGVKNNASDLHLSAGLPPMIRVDGDIRRINVPALDHKAVHALVYDIMNDKQRKENDKQRKDYEEFLETDFSFEIPNLARFRVNAFNHNRGAGAVFRTIPSKILSLEDLKCPPVFKDIADQPRGIVLVTGPTGSGKSTTLAAIIDYVNRTYRKHIITLEDPIEVIHTPKLSLINQREMGTHSANFQSALRSTLREDPDVILVGEMRDPETISFAITAAETGHLVFGTVHTTTADTSVDRIINAFPHGQQPQVRSILAGSLRAVLCQLLVPRRDGKGRIPAVEIMLNTDAVSNLIRKGKTFQIPNIVAVSRELGMQSMDHDLIRLYRSRVISADEGYMRAINKKDFEAAVVDHDTGSSRAVAALSGELNAAPSGKA